MGPGGGERVYFRLSLPLITISSWKGKGEHTSVCVCVCVGGWDQGDNEWREQERDG